jgi:membrane protease YdiL (CAAX protease family)
VGAVGRCEPESPQQERPRGSGIDGEVDDSMPDTATDEAPGNRFVRLGLLFYGAMAAVAVIWRMGFYAEPILYADAAGEARGLALVSDLALGLAVGALVVVASNLTTRYTGWGEELARAMGSALGPISTPNAVLLAFASGMAEEMLFRGALQPRVGLVLASLLFGCVHFVPNRIFLPWTVFAVLVGGLLGLLFQWTGNLVAPATAHILVNAINLPLLIRRYGPGGTQVTVSEVDEDVTPSPDERED